MSKGSVFLKMPVTFRRAIVGLTVEAKRLVRVKNSGGKDTYRTESGTVKIDVSHLGLLTIISLHMNAEGYAWPAYDLIAEQGNITRKTAISLVTQLEAAGFLRVCGDKEKREVEQKYNRGNQINSNVYRILAPFSVTQFAGETVAQNETAQQKAQSVMPLNSVQWRAMFCNELYVLGLYGTDNEDAQDRCAILYAKCVDAFLALEADQITDTSFLEASSSVIQTLLEQVTDIPRDSFYYRLYTILVERKGGEVYRASEVPDSGFTTASPAAATAGLAQGI